MEPGSSQWCKVGGQVTDIRWKKRGLRQFKVCILHVTFSPTKAAEQRCRRLDQRSANYLLTWIFLSSQVSSFVSSTKRQCLLPVLHEESQAGRCSTNKVIWTHIMFLHSGWFRFYTWGQTFRKHVSIEKIWELLITDWLLWPRSKYNLRNTQTYTYIKKKKSTISFFVKTASLSAVGISLS